MGLPSEDALQFIWCHFMPNSERASSRSMESRRCLSCVLLKRFKRSFIDNSLLTQKKRYVPAFCGVQEAQCCYRRRLTYHSKDGRMHRIAGQCHYPSMLHVISSYWQVKLAKEDRERSLLVQRYGIFPIFLERYGDIFKSLRGTNQTLGICLEATCRWWSHSWSEKCESFSNTHGYYGIVAHLGALLIP